MANKFRDAGTIDRFGLAFQYQINKIMKKNGQKQLQIKNSIYMHKDYYQCHIAA